MKTFEEKKFRFWKKNRLRYRKWTLVLVPDTETETWFRSHTNVCNVILFSFQTNRQVCALVPITNCYDVPKEVCNNDPITTCNQVPKQNCYDVEENVCVDVVTNNCEQIETSCQFVKR